MKAEERPILDSGLLSIKRVCAEVDLSRSTWLKLVATGKAPEPIRIPGTRNVRWTPSQINNWIEGLAK